MTARLNGGDGGEAERREREEVEDLIRKGVLTPFDRRGAGFAEEKTR